MVLNNWPYQKKNLEIGSILCIVIRLLAQILYTTAAEGRRMAATLIWWIDFNRRESLKLG